MMIKDSMTREQFADFLESCIDKVVLKTDSGLEIRSEEVNKKFIEKIRTIRTKGKWVLTSMSEDDNPDPNCWWKCSECGHLIYSTNSLDRTRFHAFCGKCGADMRESEVNADVS